MSQQEAVLLDIADGIAGIRMNRPERLNALDDSLNVGLNEALLRVDLDPSVKVVTLTGEGRAFMAGGDVSGLVRRPDSRIRFCYCGGRHEFYSFLHDPQDQSGPPLHLPARPTAGPPSHAPTSHPAP